MDVRNVTVGALAEATGLSDHTIKNMRNKADIMFPIYGEALHGLSLLYGRMSHEHRHSGVFLPVQRRHAGES